MCRFLLRGHDEMQMRRNIRRQQYRSMCINRVRATNSSSIWQKVFKLHAAMAGSRLDLKQLCPTHLAGEIAFKQGDLWHFETHMDTTCRKSIPMPRALRLTPCFRARTRRLMITTAQSQYAHESG